MKSLSIYKICIKTAVSQAVAYRFNFFLSLLITFLGSLLLPLVAVLIYGAGASFPGWSFHEVLLIQSLFTVSQAMAKVCLGNVLWDTMIHVREGSFEVVLLKPMEPLAYMIATTFSPDSFGNLLCGLALFGYAAAHAQIVSAAAAIGAGLLLFIAGVAVMAGIQIIMAATSFKWVGNSRLPEIFGSVEAFGQYPIAIFPSAIRAVATFIVPVSLVGFFPAAALLGRAEPEAFWGAGLSLLFLGFGVWLYQHMIRRYKGAGG
ncbi:MAG: ABC-2 family transporter protein [Oscillospiraceae bacterium]|nr:ABC-2 family transporter protein [Oscillospiraceae bacterium]